MLRKHWLGTTILALFSVGLVIYEIWSAVMDLPSFLSWLEYMAGTAWQYVTQYANHPATHIIMGVAVIAALAIFAVTIANSEERRELEIKSQTQAIIADVAKEIDETAKSTLARYDRKLQAFFEYWQLSENRLRIHGVQEQITRVTSSLEDLGCEVIKYEETVKDAGLERVRAGVNDILFRRLSSIEYLFESMTFFLTHEQRAALTKESAPESYHCKHCDDIKSTKTRGEYRKKHYKLHRLANMCNIYINDLDNAANKAHDKIRKALNGE